MPDDFYQQMDAAGILINAGYQCCDCWEVSGTLRHRGQRNTISCRHRRSVRRCAITPAVFSFQWSDNAPTTTQESACADRVRRGRLLRIRSISSAEYKSSPQLGVSGEKEGPVRLGSRRTTGTTRRTPTGDDHTDELGGAWGFDSERVGRQHRTDAGLAQPVPVDGRPVDLWQKPSTPTSTTTTTRARSTPGTRSARSTTSIPRSPIGTVRGIQLNQYVEEAQVAEL